MDDQNSAPELSNLPALIEALLFVSPSPVTLTQLAAALEVPVPAIESSIQELENKYNDPANPRGLQIQKHHGRVQLTTHPSLSALIERFLGLEAGSRLSQAALETLAVIAYREPVTRPKIDAIRGVNSDGVLKTLLSKGLVQEIGRADAPGRPILYSITNEFLQYFGLQTLDDLPALEDSRETPEGDQAE